MKDERGEMKEESGDGEEGNEKKSIERVFYALGIRRVALMNAFLILQSRPELQ